MLIFSKYIEDKIDMAWFDSSNIVYAECDESDTAEKTVRVTFKNGSQYEYYKVNVNDWVMFKNADSQGKALNKYIKKDSYEYKKIWDNDIESINKKLEFYLNDEKEAEEDDLKAKYLLSFDNGRLEVCNGLNETIYSADGCCTKTYEVVHDILKLIGIIS
jgi:hypothetical protein